jgi:limonene-1,2-epoxide hydrolase
VTTFPPTAPADALVPGPKETVAAFLAALERLDVDAAMAFAAKDISYQNVPLRPARGYNAVEKQLKTLFGRCTGFEARISHLAADGPIVLTERVDVLKFRAWEAEFWVCGTFEVRDGRIVLWRDYFDWATFLAASARGLWKTAAGSPRRVRGRRRDQKRG